MYVFGERYHLPPVILAPPRSILDLGSNIGLTLANYAQLFPEARILGVELDEDNADLCERNIQPWWPRVKVLRGAVWSEDGSVTYSGDGEDAYHISLADGAARVKTARAYSMQSIMEQFGVPEIDYIKMDIEGAEQAVLADPGPWIHKVGCFNIEVHAPYSVDACIASLTRFHFHCKVHSRNPPGVVAINQRLLANVSS
jgi:FkbM family methyltransferase